MTRSKGKRTKNTENWCIKDKRCCLLHSRESYPTQRKKRDWFQGANLLSMKDEELLSSKFEWVTDGRYFLKLMIPGLESMALAFLVHPSNSSLATRNHLQSLVGRKNHRRFDVAPIQRIQLEEGCLELSLSHHFFLAQQ